MSQRVPLTIRLDSFEGPLDLLLYLIQSHEMDISRISISRITDQYLSHVRLMQELNFDLASEFLVMAATLLHWKSKALLPQEKDAEAATDEGGDVMTQEDLIRQLLEHQRFRAAGEELAQLPRLGEDVFARPNSRPPIEKVWKQMDVSTLSVSFQDTLVRARKRTQVLKKETVSLTDKMTEFVERLSVGEITALQSLLSLEPTRGEWVVTFLAALEFSRLKKMRLHQQDTYQPVYLELIEAVTNFDLNFASGFEPEPKPAEALEPAPVLEPQL
jgi:segregation and condensation protein A